MQKEPGPPALLRCWWKGLWGNSSLARQCSSVLFGQHLEFYKDSVTSDNGEKLESSCFECLTGNWVTADSWACPFLCRLRTFLVSEKSSGVITLSYFLSSVSRCGSVGGLLSSCHCGKWVMLSFSSSVIRRLSPIKGLPTSLTWNVHFTYSLAHKHYILGECQGQTQDSVLSHPPETP